MERAVVLAAGMGSRLTGDEPYPKPLKAVGGVPLLVRVLRTLQAEGIREAVIVTGHLGHRVREALRGEPSLVLALEFVENPRYELRNGLSLLAAREHVRADCLLSMADHLYAPEVVRRLRHLRLPRGACALAVDHDVERCFDLDDATKVRTQRGKIVDIGKDLARYNAIDTGVFRIGPALLDELSRLADRNGDCSLSDGVRALAAEGRFLACDVGDARWIDVDTPAAYQRAEAMVRVFGDALGDEPTASTVIDPSAIEGFAPSWVRAAQPYAEKHFELAASREGIARMMSNESPFPPSPRVVEAILRAALEGNRYPSGARELRTRLAGREGLDERQVLLGAGSTELIDVLIRAFVAPGEEVVISVPTFSMYEARTRTAGGIPVLVPLGDGDQVDAPRVVASVTERTKVLFLCSPNNPTGRRVDEATVRRLLRLGLPTVVDEAYYDFAGEGSESLAHLLHEFPNLVILRTFSKAYGLAGMRLGYALGHPAAIQLLGRVQLPWSVNAITIAAAAAALDDAAVHEERLAVLREGRLYLERELGRLPGLVPLPSEGNFVLLDVHDTGLSAEAIVAALVERGVLIRSLASHHAGRTFVRVTVGTTEENRRCVEALRALLERPAAARGEGTSPVGPPPPRPSRPGVPALAAAAPADAE